MLALPHGAAPQKSAHDTVDPRLCATDRALRMYRRGDDLIASSKVVRARPARLREYHQATVSCTAETERCCCPRAAGALEGRLRFALHLEWLDLGQRERSLLRDGLGEGHRAEGGLDVL